ncbi:MAG: hypothetical protein AAF416_17375 [Pseudomonadota bacterium]
MQPLDQSFLCFIKLSLGDLTCLQKVLEIIERFTELSGITVL